MPDTGLLDELRWRGLIYQQTEGLETALASGTISAYAGFDPTAPSLHVGNLVPVMALAHLQRHGHRAIVLAGGGTGLIGDPSGKATERSLNDASTVEENTRLIRSQLERFLPMSGQNAASVRDNIEWLRPLNAIDFLRDVGKHFTVNYMIAKDSVKSRMEAGISFTEFAYMLLQAFDYRRLHELEGVSLQVGGSDQWGNITAGIELIRRATGAAVHGLTVPLVTTSSGTKFGKTEAGAVWLDSERTSPYRFYQFWIQTDDRDVGRYLRLFTLLDRQRIEELEQLATSAPGKREAQQALAREVTERVHGPDAARAAEQVSSLLFGQAEPGTLSADAFLALGKELPPAVMQRTAFPMDVVDLVVHSQLATSKGAARRLFDQGGVYINGKRATAESRSVTEDALIHDRWIVVRKGARDNALIALS